MDFLILGDGPEERAWGRALADRAGHRVVAAWPGFEGLPEGVAVASDLEAALATAGVEAVVVGGPLGGRDEALRRVAAAGLAAICLHPPGPNADPYYQVALSRAETGAVVVPDLPGRLHPGVAALRAGLAGGGPGDHRGLRVEAAGEPGHPDLAEFAFPRWVDLTRAILGEVASLSAVGDPPGPGPSRSLTVHLRAGSGHPAEVRLVALGPGAVARVVASGESGSLTLELPGGWDGPSRLIRSDGSVEDLPPFDPHGAILDTLARAVAGRASHPDLLDGTRAMELTSAVAKALRKGRSVDLHYEEVSEAGNFKTVMTSLGCLILLGILVVLPLALAGPALGFGQTIYLAYAIPPVLIAFATLQLLKLGLKPAKAPATLAGDEDD